MKSLCYFTKIWQHRERENTKLVTYKGFIIIHVSFITSCILKLNIPDRKLTSDTVFISSKISLGTAFKDQL